MLREVAIMKKIKHPNLIRLNEVIDDEAADKMYMIIEFAEKGSVLEWDEANQTFYHPAELNISSFSEEQIRQWFRGMVHGLDYLHQHNIIHRDLKP